MPPKKKVETIEEAKEEEKGETNEETKLKNLKQKFKENKKKVKEDKKKEKEDKKKEKGEKKKLNTIKQTAKGTKSKNKSTSKGKGTGKGTVKKEGPQVKGNENPDTILEDNSMDNTTFKSDYREIINTYNPSNNKTNNIMTIYEAALIIGKRTTQITYGAEPVIEYSETDTPESIAIRELLTKKIPYIIKREINNVVEYWKIDDMQLDEEAITIYY
jgi:DNA-directed RNA polymerase subunit K/omega